MRKYEVSINNKHYSVVVKKYTENDAELEINGKPYSVKLDAPITTNGAQLGPVPGPTQATPVVQAAPVSPAPVQAAPAPQPQAIPTPPPQAAPVPATPATPQAAPAVQGGEIIRAPIPGSILDILVKVGDAINEGQTVFKMEAMKMENDINAVGSGVVKAINVAVGDAVNQGQELMVIG
jgi:biotin carboxyl carrier protein